MGIHYLPADETLTGRNGVFPRWRESEAQPLMLMRRMDLRSQLEWRGCSASHIRDGLHIKHLEPRHADRVRRLQLTALPTTGRRSYSRRMARYAQHLAMAKALRAAKPSPVYAVDCPF